MTEGSFSRYGLLRARAGQPSQARRLLRDANRSGSQLWNPHDASELSFSIVNLSVSHQATSFSAGPSCAAALSTS
jgi:hypothetical protein